MQILKTLFIRPLMLVAFLVALGSCQTLTKKECEVADWSLLGETDGAAGRPADYILKHAKACARVDVVPDQTLWLAGHEKGLVRYCTPRNAVQVGLTGQSHSNVCPVERQAAFQAGYDVGRRVHDARSRRDSIVTDISIKEAERSSLTSELGKDTSKDAGIRAEISQLDQDIGFLYGSRGSADVEVGRAEAEMESYLASLPL